ncbi:hypothetical protein [Caballeronia sp. Lep1P3]|jgi:hypothetical protein|uniref:hypothetical protein n=1 Tax=Caballeronia sp. Lep1P3 TaxID=2878150 RepID=UPI001FD37910|nr:hypothetical protein [Caballeronia sp. Lep1P3]
MFVAGAAISQESHLTLDDIDKLARAKLVDSMRGPQGGQGGQGGSAAPGNGVGLASPLGAPTPAPVTAAPPAAPKAERRPSAPPRRVIPATFVGAYSDMSGSYVLYDYQGTTYTARQGSRLLNGWTVASIDGFTVNLVDGKHKWTETIVAPADAPAVALPDSPAVRAITDLSSPLPPGGVSSTASTFVPFGK